MSEVQHAILCSATPPTRDQEVRLLVYLHENFDKNLDLLWRRSDELNDGFRLYIGPDVFDWSVEGRLRQLKGKLDEAAAESAADGEDVLPRLENAVKSFTPAVEYDDRGVVMSVSDETARVADINASYGEILTFDGGVTGMVQDVREDSVGCILFGKTDGISAGSLVYRTKRTAGIPVGEKFLGRVVSALGEPIDGRGPIEPDGYREVEAEAPGIMQRKSIDTPLQSGLLAIDSMFPIGRGQRELIIGDRQTGKTAIAVDTILNQKGKDVICIYVAIGQKSSGVAQLCATLEQHEAMDYTIVVSAPAGASASEQYIAPYAGCALGEYFMYSGRDVLIVYDDLSKHAIAYRALSLLLERSPGREAFPGDVFYLHSRLLERAAKLSDELGGGSMTALPIIETQAGDVSAYIPTNVISITDGQIYLESNLFFSGQRPAVNVGLSVSRVGGNAQTKAMKKSSGSLRLDLAQYREMEVFTQFSSDLDEATKNQLIYGQGLMLLLRQNQYSPLSQHQQVVLLLAALAHTMQKIPLAELADYRTALLRAEEEQNGEILRSIDRTGVFSEEERAQLIQTAEAFAEAYLADKQGR